MQQKTPSFGYNKSCLFLQHASSSEDGGTGGLSDILTLSPPLKEKMMGDTMHRVGNEYQIGCVRRVKIQQRHLQFQPHRRHNSSSREEESTIDQSIAKEEPVVISHD